MRRFLKALPIALSLSALALPATSDEHLLAALSDMGITVTDELRQLVESGIDSGDIGPVLEAMNGDLSAIAAIISSAVAANPDMADQIVSAAILANPAAAGVITKAAITAVSGSGGTADAMIVSIVTAAVKAAPAQGESVRSAAVTAAPGSSEAINSAVNTALVNAQNVDTQQDPPSPS